ncbi:hypothetical protein BDV98DRAFT_558752 [Pterulicium gracile]|uniref:Uncharacterized protein n=1 Tax=Pterulicium gracile TaxID=1884261 RepID=A0A5C3R0F9_9AGAR|nr:hypothetical protein BDV98DRAFT_558752 [Pterula gracilis]
MPSEHGRGRMAARIGEDWRGSATVTLPSFANSCLPPVVKLGLIRSPLPILATSKLALTDYCQLLPATAEFCHTLPVLTATCTPASSRQSSPVAADPTIGFCSTPPRSTSPLAPLRRCHTPIDRIRVLACALIRAENDDRKGAEGKSTETQVDADAARCS